MKRKRQRRADDCGVACVAMVASVNYAQALNAFGPWKDNSRRTTTTDLKRALKALKIDVGYRTFPINEARLPQLTHDAIVLITGPRGGRGHWVVWDARRARILDPSDDPRLIVQAYLPVYRRTRRPC